VTVAATTARTGKNGKSNNQPVAAVEAQWHLQCWWHSVASGDSMCAMQSGEGDYK